jgi:type IV pilus assembly protein PilA
MHRTSTKKKLLGFSLIELMVVVAIVGVLSAVALPNYRNYVTRSKLAVGMPILTFLKNQATDYYNTNGTWPAALSDLNLNVGGTNYAATTIGTGNIVSIGIGASPTGCTNSGTSSGQFCIFITYNSLLIATQSAPVLAFSVNPTANGDLLVWKCVTTVIANVATSSIPAGLLPGGCIVPT